MYWFSRQNRLSLTRYPICTLTITTVLAIDTRADTHTLSHTHTHTKSTVIALHEEHFLLELVSNLFVS